MSLLCLFSDYPIAYASHNVVLTGKIIVFTRSHTFPSTNIARDKCRCFEAVYNLALVFLMSLWYKSTGNTGQPQILVQMKPTKVITRKRYSLEDNQQSRIAETN